LHDHRTSGGQRQRRQRTSYHQIRPGVSGAEDAERRANHGQADVGIIAAALQDGAPFTRRSTLAQRLALLAAIGQIRVHIARRYPDGGPLRRLHRLIERAPWRRLCRTPLTQPQPSVPDCIAQPDDACLI
jgi:hypothetical protein